MNSLPDQLRTAAVEVAALGEAARDFHSLTVAGLLEAQASITTLRHCVDRYAALAAGEIAHRSRPEEGHSGLAQAAGFLSPEAMLQSVSSLPRHEAVTLVRIGTMIAQTEAAQALALEVGLARSNADSGPDEADDAGAARATGAGFGAPPWQAPLVAALATGVLSLPAVDSIRKGLGDIDPAITAAQLAAACELLIAAAPGMTPEQLFRRARQTRDGLDENGIERREKERRDLRSVRSWWDASGMHCGSWRLPPEEGMIIATALDQILSPRRGGPRFVDPDEKATAEQLMNDERTTEQIAADALVDMIRLAVDADPGTMFGRRRPAVRVLVAQDDLLHRTGHGRVEGHPDPVSFSTVERHLCDTGAIAIGFDDEGQCVNVGRNKRLFTERQRTGMTIRDGGCRFPGCDRPPSYCEAHHINQWARDDGETNIADGILMCRRHHLLLHNNKWQITRHRAEYFLKPPRSVDAHQQPIPIPSRNPAVLAFRKQARSG